MNELKHYANAFAQAEAIYKPKVADLAKRAAEIRAKPIRNARETMLVERIDRLVGNVVSAAHGHVPRERALFVIGESGAGKSFAIDLQLHENPAFQPYLGAHGRQINSVLKLELRSSTRRKDLAMSLISKLNPDLPLHPRITEDALFALLKTQLKERGIVYLVIDEAQHLLRGKDVLAVQNLIKSLLDTEWPLNIILCGVESLSRLLQDDNQLANRSHVMRFERLRYPADAGRVRQWLKAVIEEDCHLVADAELLKTEMQLLEGETMDDRLFSDEFIHRLIASGGGAFGTVILLARNACLLAIENGRDVVGLRHFKRAYEDKTGCLPADNIFTAKNFDLIDPRKATADLDAVTPKTSEGRRHRNRK